MNFIAAYIPDAIFIDCLETVLSLQAKAYKMLENIQVYACHFSYEHPWLSVSQNSVGCIELERIGAFSILMEA